MDKNTHFLLSFWGSFVCLDPATGNLVQKWLGVEGDWQPLGFQVSGMSLQSPIWSHQQFSVAPSSRSGLICLKAKGLFLCADNEANVTLSRETGDDWETFLLVSEQDFVRFVFFLNHNWVKSGDNTFVDNSDIAFIRDFQLSVGKDIFDLRQNTSLDLVSREWIPDSHHPEYGFGLCTIWQKNWQPVDYLLFRPLVYFCVFGEFSLILLSVSLKSLKMAASEDNDVLIITDLSKSVISEALSDVLPERLHVMSTTAHDFVDFTSARYLISEWDSSNKFQPFLYVDADVVFDLHTRPMLIDLLLSSKLSAQLEPFAPLKTWNAVGAELIREAGLSVDDTTCGFNAGIIGIPCGSPHLRTFGKIMRAIYRYAEVSYDRKGSSPDQQVANYISYLTNSFDCTLISSFVRWYDGDGIVGGNTKMGLVHFWGGGSEKISKMEQYLEELRLSLAETPP